MASGRGGDVRVRRDGEYRVDDVTLAVTRVLPSDREPPASPANDVDFIDQLVPHHEDAMAMADEVLARGADA